MAKIRVLVVEDSLTVRRRLCEVLASDPEIEVAGEAPDGKRAIELCRDLRPDVLTLDMLLPVMTGLSATEYIMSHFPTPILIVSSSTNRGELFKTYDALAAGAVDVLEKPRGDEVDDEWERRLLSTVKLVSRIKVITHPRMRLGAFGRESSSVPVAPTVPLPPAGEYRVLGLGASTGGPGAIVEVLRSIPAPLPIPVLVVLHIDEPFGSAFADWLDDQTPHSVTYPNDGQPLAALIGKVVMAPPGRHMVVRGGRIALTNDAERNFCRPSVDVLFESMAREYKKEAIACLLTGMGRDGAQGLLEICKAGGLTVAQDEASSIVYGMPREAVLLGAAARVLPLSTIGPTVAELLSSRKGGAR